MLDNQSRGMLLHTLLALHLDSKFKRPICLFERFTLNLCFPLPLLLFHGDVLEAEHTLLCLHVIPAQLLPLPPLVVGSIHEQTSTGTEKLLQCFCSNRSKDNC